MGAVSRHVGSQGHAPNWKPRMVGTASRNGSHARWFGCREAVGRHIPQGSWVANLIRAIARLAGVRSRWSLTLSKNERLAHSECSGPPLASTALISVFPAVPVQSSYRNDRQGAKPRPSWRDYTTCTAFQITLRHTDVEATMSRTPLGGSLSILPHNNGARLRHIGKDLPPVTNRCRWGLN